MYLKRIELSGFKSFATKTILDFLPSCSLVKNGKQCGITAIVGPNGSGKSNIADAVRWAMGEQSLKNLRGKKSEDVIFAGSGKKAQLGSAKVSLIFSNSDRRIPIEFEEVIITRKVYRSGEGEYFVNNSKVRLLDIADLLAKAGVGQRSYCIINQGMADAVLNATPQERRIIVEEAAGVKPFQLKRERSLRKLETTKNNLARAGDLTKEIEPHLRVLRRQAEKAKKGEDVARELRVKQEELFGYLWRKIKSEKTRVLQDKEEVAREVMKLQRKIDDLEAKIRKESKSGIDFEGKRESLESERQDIFSKITQAQKDLAIAEAKIEIEKEKVKNFTLISEISVDLPYIKEKLAQINSRFREISENLERCGSLEELAGLKNDFGDLGRQIGFIYREVAEGKKHGQQDSGGEHEAQRENVINLKIAGELEKRKKEFSELLASLTAEEAENKKKIAELIAVDKEARKYYFDLENEKRRVEHNMSAVRDKMSEIRIMMAKVEVREEDLAARIKEELRIADANEVLKEKSESDGNSLDIEKYERDIGRLKTLHEQIGAIDPLIIEEFEETQKRYDYLTAQSQDLEKAIGSLTEVIKEMNEKIKVSFEETFKKINSEFSKYFKIVFSGGNAELKKVDVSGNKRDISREEGENGEDADGVDDTNSAEEIMEEKTKEIGIEIKACPPGKRISTLAMLSGGERALTSQALLFAIISNSPPPFAVLDEVEAALDEANSRRFGRILQELAHQTQFILITHNRETMRQASALYGVTMSADGISKILSVKLDQVGAEGEIG